MSQYKQCAQCGQWLNLSTKHYVVENDGENLYFHYYPCLQRYREVYVVDDAEIHLTNPKELG